MPELTAEDVESYTQGRLEDDDQTVILLAAALGAARRYCGWHVTPLHTDEEVVLDGPGTPLLVLPTLKLVELTALTEDGVDVDLDYVAASSRGLCRKKNGYPLTWPAGYRWTGEYNGITATMTHGYTDAPDWQSAVLSLIDRMGAAASGGELTTIGPFTYATTSAEAGSLFTAPERMILDMYRLEAPA